MNWFITDNTASAVALEDIPESGYAEFYNDLASYLTDPRYHVAHLVRTMKGATPSAVSGSVSSKSATKI